MIQLAALLTILTLISLGAVIWATRSNNKLNRKPSAKVVKMSERLSKELNKKLAMDIETIQECL